LASSCGYYTPRRIYGEDHPNEELKLYQQLLIPAHYRDKARSLNLRDRRFPFTIGSS
jgi:hypothetical protein